MNNKQTSQETNRKGICAMLDMVELGLPMF